MEIVFDLKKLKETVNSLYIDQIGEPLTAHKCISIEHIGNNTTKLTTFSPRKLTHSININHEENTGGLEGTTFLCDHLALKKILESWKKVSKVSMRHEAGTIALFADERIEDNKRQYLGREFLHQYPGEHSDFEYNKLGKLSKVVAEIEEKELKKWINSLERFGGNDNNPDYVIYLRAFQKVNLLFGCTTNKGNSSGFIFTTTGGDIKTDFNCTIPRNLTSRIKSIIPKFSDIKLEIFKEEGYIEFRSRFGSVVSMDSERGNPHISPAIEAFRKSANLNTFIDIVVHIPTFTKSLESKTTDSGKILITSAKTQLKLLDPSDIHQRSYFNVDIELTPPARSEKEKKPTKPEWIDCIVFNEVLQAMLNSLLLFSKSNDESENMSQEVRVSQKYMENGNLLLYLFINNTKFLGSSNSQSIGGLICARKVEESDVEFHD